MSRLGCWIRHFAVLVSFAACHPTEETSRLGDVATTSSSTNYLHYLHSDGTKVVRTTCTPGSTLLRRTTCTSDRQMMLLSQFAQGLMALFAPQVGQQLAEGNQLAARLGDVETRRSQFLSQQPPSEARLAAKAQLDALRDRVAQQFHMLEQLRDQVVRAEDELAVRFDPNISLQLEHLQLQVSQETIRYHELMIQLENAQDAFILAYADINDPQVFDLLTAQARTLRTQLQATHQAYEDALLVAANARKALNLLTDQNFTYDFSAAMPNDPALSPVVGRFAEVFVSDPALLGGELAPGWHRMATPPHGCNFASADAWNGKMIVWCLYGHSAVETEERRAAPGLVYNPALNRWARFAPRNITIRVGNSAVVAGDELMIWGGSGDNASGWHPAPGSPGSSTQITDGAMEKYDLRTGVQMIPIVDGDEPSHRSYHSAVVIADRIYVWGGQSEVTSGVLRDGGVFDHRTSTWETIPTTGAPTARYNHAVAAVGRKMLIWGGTDGTMRFTDGALYDTVQRRWEPLPTTGLNPCRSMRRDVATTVGGKVFLWQDWCKTAFLFDPVTAHWSAVDVPSSVDTHIWPTVVAIGNKVFIWSGGDGRSTVASLVGDVFVTN